MPETSDAAIDPLAGRILGAGSNELQRAIDVNTRAVQGLANVLRKESAPTAAISAWYTRSDGRQVLNNPKTTAPAPMRTMSLAPMPVPDPVYSQRAQTTSVAATPAVIRSAGPGVSLDKLGVSLAKTPGVVPLTPTSYPTRGRTTTVGFVQAATGGSATPAVGASGNGGGINGGLSLSKITPPPPRGPNGGSPSGTVPPGGPGGGGGGGGNGGGGGGTYFNWRNAARNAQRVSNTIGAWGAGLVKTGSVMDSYSQWAGIGNAAPYSSDGTNGGSVNAIRKAVFGSQGMNTIGWAQDVQDAQRAAFTVSRNSGYTELTPGTNQTINPGFTNYLGNVKDLSVLNPMLSASQSANMMGTLTGSKGLYSAQLFGYKSVLGPGGRVDRNALGGFSDSVMARTFGGKRSIKAEELKASLGQNGSLHGNIAAYVRSAGGDASMTTALEDYITGRNTAQQKGLSGSEFDSLLSQYEQGGDTGKAAGKRLRKFGVSNTILQSQKDLNGAKTSTVSDLMDSLGPAVKNANEALKTFHNWLNDIVNMPGIKQVLGSVAGWGSVFGPAAGSAFGAMAGMRLGGGALGAAGSLMGMAPVTRAGTPSGIMTRSSMIRGGLYGAGGLAVGMAGDAIASHVKDPKKRKYVRTGSSALSYGLAGAGIGTMIAPGIGTAIGGGIGALAGGISGWLSDDDSTTGNDGQAGGASAPEGSGSSKKKKSTPDDGHSIAGKTAAGAIHAALGQIGKPYEWGGTGPDAFDCSGLMQWAYKKIGVRLPRISSQQMHVGKAVKRSDVRPGDLMFPNSGHVAMYIGNGKLVEAPRPGQKIRIAPITEYGKYAAIRRIVGAVGTYSSGDDQDSNTQKDQTGNSGGDSGSMVLSNAYGSTEEVDSIAAALAESSGVLLNTPMGDSASGEESDDGDEDLSGIDTKGPWKKNDASIKKAEALGQKMAAQMYGWKGSQWSALKKLWINESNWRWWADNPHSDAYGIPQSLPGSKMASAGKDWKNNPATQIKWGLHYIKDRYKTPEKALRAWNSRSPHWYDTGAWEIPEDQHAVVHKGEMIIERPKADTIRQALMRDVTNIKEAGGSGKATSTGKVLTLNFQAGSVVLSLPNASPAAARGAANSFVNALAENERLKALGEGL